MDLIYEELAFALTGKCEYNAFSDDLAYKKYKDVSIGEINYQIGDDNIPFFTFPLYYNFWNLVSREIVEATKNQKDAEFLILLNDKIFEYTVIYLSPDDGFVDEMARLSEYTKEDIPLIKLINSERFIDLDNEIKNNKEERSDKR